MVFTKQVLEAAAATVVVVVVVVVIVVAVIQPTCVMHSSIIT